MNASTFAAFADPEREELDGATPIEAPKPPAPPKLSKRFNPCAGAIVGARQSGRQIREHCTADAEPGYGLCQRCSRIEADYRASLRDKHEQPTGDGRRRKWGGE